jgi:hypothetical protein
MNKNNELKEKLKKEIFLEDKSSKRIIEDITKISKGELDSNIYNICSVIAIENNSFEVYKYLIDNYEICIDIKSHGIYASNIGNLEIYKYAVEHGADIHIDLVSKHAIKNDNFSLNPDLFCIMGVPEEPIKHGTIAQLRKFYSIDTDEIVNNAKRLIEKKKRLVK